MIGGGTMGRSIALASARAGYRVILVEQNEQVDRIHVDLAQINIEYYSW